MNTRIILFALLIVPLAIMNLFPAGMDSETTTPPPGITPTIDIFAEPPMPDDPNQLELGRHVYWHHCMPCHGDAGQGLTDEFRLQWEPDHQNCWDPGCHSGRYRYDSFPIPTYVPPLVDVGLTTRYDSATLLAFLESTHPPQDPGLLTEEEYHALVVFLHALNGEVPPRQTILLTATPSVRLLSTPTPSPSPATPTESASPSNTKPAFLLYLLGGFLFLAVISIILITRKKP
jgi:hypothetical protein